MSVLETLKSVTAAPKGYLFRTCHSGKVPLIGVLSAPLVGLAGAFVLSWVYGYVMVWNPFVYVSLIAVVVYGFLLGGSVAVGLQFAKVRNTPLALLLAHVGIYGGWVTLVRIE